MGDLEKRVNDLIDAGRAAGAKRTDRPHMDDPTDESIIYVTGWLNGLSDAVAEVAREVEKLSSRLDA